MLEGKITEENIKGIITAMIDAPDRCGFEVFIITKSEPKLRKMKFYEGADDNLYNKLKGSIFKVLNEKYNSEEAKFVSANRIADEQKKFYIIESNDEYNPFAMLKGRVEVFRKDDIGDATGIVYSIRNEENQIWAYQHLWNIMIPNKSKKNWMAKIVSGNEGDVFEELREPIITFAEKIDLLIIEDYIIASDYKLMQSSFGFQEYIRIRANKTIQAIEDKGIVSNIEKLTEYAQRGNGKPKYAKKLMRISDSKVLKMDSQLLWENIHKSKRWNGKIQEENGKFVLNTYTQVEDLIDLLDERYTRSDITDVEYDTEVKQVAEPVGSI